MARMIHNAPTPLMDHWREECLRALAQADPAGQDDHLVAHVVGAYFQAIHDGLTMLQEPQEQDLYGRQEAGRFLAMLRHLPEYRQQRHHEKLDAHHRDGLIVFPSTENDSEPGH